MSLPTLEAVLRGTLKTTLVHRHAFIPSVALTAAIGARAGVPASFDGAVRALLADAAGLGPIESLARRSRWAEARRRLESAGSERGEAAAAVLAGVLSMWADAGRSPGLQGMIDRCASGAGVGRLRSAAGRAPLWWPGWVWLGLGHLRRCELAEARAAFDRVLSLRPDWAWGYLLRSEWARVDIEFDSALEDLDKAAALEPGNAWGWALRARVLFQKSPGREGLAALDRAAALDSQAGWLRAWRGDARRKLGDLKGAAEDLVAARRLEPGYDRTYLWLGKVLDAAGLPGRALSILSEGVRRCPHFEKAFAQRSQVLRGLGRLGEAVADLNRAARINHRHDWLGTWTARPFPLSPRQRRWFEVLASESARRPRHAALRGWLGEARVQAGDIGDGMRDLDAVVERNPGFAWAWAWRGEALVRAGKRAEARRDLTLACRLDPNYGRAFAWRGRLATLEGNFAAALRDLSRAVGDSLVEYSWMYYWRGLAHEGLGRRGDAAKDFETAAVLEPREAQFHAARGRVSARAVPA